MEKILGLNFFVFCILILFVVLFFSNDLRVEAFYVEKQDSEGFGMSPGVMDQLASTRVVSRREQETDNEIYNNLTLQGIINMTESGYKGSDYASTASE
jgi:hypothetical protein